MSIPAEAVRVKVAGAGVDNALKRHRVLLLAVVAMILVVAIYWQSFSRMAGMWSLLNYEHCWLVFPISLYVLWRKRHALSGLPLQGSARGVAATALVVLAWLASRAIGVQVVEFAAATLLVPALFWAVAGTDAARTGGFPLLLLLTSVPAGEILVEPLMKLTSGIAGTLLELSGMPVIRDRTFFTLPGGSFEVADVCSGLRFLLAGAMASLAYAYVTYRSVKKRVLFVSIASVVLALLNGVRAFIVMYVASSTNMRVFAGRDHVLFGMALFTVVFVVLIYLGERYADPDHELRRADVRTSRGASFPMVIAVTALLVVLAGPAVEYARAHQSFPTVVDGAQPPYLPGCSGPDEYARGWSPEFVGADYVQRASYRCGGFSGTVYAAAYLRQEQGKELINSINRVWPHDWRQYVEETSVNIATDAGPVRIRQVLVQSPERSMLILYWYRTGETVTPSPFRIKLLAAVHALALDAQEASVTAIALSAKPGTDPAALQEAIEPLTRAVMYWDREKGG